MLEISDPPLSFEQFVNLDIPPRAKPSRRAAILTAAAATRWPTDIYQIVYLAKAHKLVNNGMLMFKVLRTH